MDPLAAFSLACCVIQVVDFSTKLVSNFWEICKDGALSEHEEIEELTRYLTKLDALLDVTDQGGDDELFKLATECSMTAQSLITELEKLRVNGSHRKAQVLSKVFMSTRKRKSIDKIRKRLGEYQKILDTRILVDLSKRLRMSALQQNKEFQEMDRSLQTIITDLAQSPRSFDELRSLIQIETSLMKEHITNELQQNRRNQAYEDYCQDFLNSLWYPEIHRRQETVRKAHQETFKWIYEPDGFDMSNRRWDSIVRWLIHGEGIYWVSGKAASGKSTLMSYIYDDNRTLELLRSWSGAKEILFPSHFFWSSGSALEKSSEGLLRSLLYQILREFPNLTPATNDNHSTHRLEKDGNYSFRPIPAWTEHRLQENFRDVMLEVQKTRRICILIDGIDETSDDPDAAIAVIKSMLSADAKILLSSRGDSPYINVFDSSAKLRLQDLTESDIRTYVRDKLQPFLGRDNVSDILDCILYKAQGVFLWVRLVVKDLVRGLQNDDSFTQLQARVDSTPSDIEALYAKMLNNIEDIYCPEAAFLFQIALDGRTDCLLDVTLALCKEFYRMSDISIHTAISYSRRTQKRIPIICAGLLEVNSRGKKSGEGGKKYGLSHFLSLPREHACSSEQKELSFFERCAYVTFIHRTAIDFLRKNKQAQHFLDLNVQHSSSRPALVRGLLAKVTLLGFSDNPGHHSNGIGDLDAVACDFVLRVMDIMCTEEWETDTAQVSLCDDVDRTLAVVGQRFQTETPLSHWCVQWDMMARRSIRRVFQPSRASSLWNHNIISSPTTTGESTLVEHGPVNFPGFAATWALSRSVLEMFDLRQSQPDRQYTNYMLFCSVLALSTRGISRASHLVCQLIVGFLTRGGKPNVYVEHFSTTIWGVLLTGNFSFYPRNYFATIMKAFLESGADLQIKVPASFLLSPDNENSHSVPEAEIHVRLEHSVLYFINVSFETSSETKPLEDFISDKGGLKFCRRVTHVAFKAENYRVCKITEDQDKELIKTFDAGRLYETHASDQRVFCDTLLFEKFKEILGRVGDSDRDTSSDEDAASDLDTEQDSHDSVDTPIVANEQDTEPVE